MPVEMPPAESRPLEEGELFDPEQSELVWLILTLRSKTISLGLLSDESARRGASRVITIRQMVVG
jgi:hypothetical protein